jgi:hypothetical protein
MPNPMMPNRGGPWRWHSNRHDREWRGRDGRGTPSWHQYWCRLFIDGSWCDCADPPGPPGPRRGHGSGGAAEKATRKAAIDKEAEEVRGV